jgi:hypothetical protein
MQTEFKIENINNTNQKKNLNHHLILTERDLEIIKFICEMKFASIDEIYFKFFKTLKNGSESKSKWWARERLTDLVKSNYLTKLYSFSDRKAYYLGSVKGYLKTSKRYPPDFLVKPLMKIDHSTFEHDKLVLQIRLHYETNKKIADWISDRKLQFTQGVHSLLGEGNTPDGIYTTSENEKIAFELELSVKAKLRYEQKIRKYISIIRDRKNDIEVFKKVHFIVSSEVAYKYLVQYSKLYKDFFLIEKTNIFDLKNGFSI